MRNRFSFLIFTFMLICIDQWSKYFCLSRLSLGEPYHILPGLNFTLQFNTGAAFSFLADANGWQRWFFITFTWLIIAGIFYWLKQTKCLLEKYALLLILSGAIGNLLDRILYGYVVDFIDVYYRSWHFATFNFADSAICAGALLFCLNTLFLNHKTEH